MDHDRSARDPETLVLPEFAPIGVSIAFVDGPLAQVADHYVKWTRGIGWPVRPDPLNGDLATLLRRLPPLTTTAERVLFTSTASSWTAIFDNSLDGGQFLSPVSMLVELLGTRAALTTYVPHTFRPELRRGSFGARAFTYFEPEGTPAPWRIRRFVAAAHDGGRWVWHSDDEPLPFERREGYGARRVKDRLTPEMLIAYNHALGIDIANAAFYGPKAILVDHSGWPRARRLSLGEARKEQLLER